MEPGSFGDSESELSAWWFMSGKPGYLWTALVWVLIPFTMAAGLPRMHCRCAAAKGLMFCECCFPKSSSDESNGSDASDSDLPVRNCCRHKEVADESNRQTVADKSLVATQSNSDCPICPQVTERRPGSCCNWTSAVLTAPTDSVTPSVPDALVHWDIILCEDAPSILASFAQYDSTTTLLPQLDRLTVSQHLVI